MSYIQLRIFFENHGDEIISIKTASEVSEENAILTINNQIFIGISNAITIPLKKVLYSIQDITQVKTEPIRYGLLLLLKSSMMEMVTYQL